MYTPDPNEKFDFQNMDVKLYLALKKLTQEYQALDADVSGTLNWEAVRVAELTMTEFEQSFGPIPDWAVSRNFAYELVPGAQLCTRDGRRTGNAHIIKVNEYKTHDGTIPLYHCLSDAGSKFACTEVEVHNQFTVGDWISDVARILKDFDRNGEFANEQ